MNLTDDVTALHWVLAVALLSVGVGALFAPRRLTGVVLFLVFGVFLSSYWALLGAPDVALAEAVIGTGVTGALFGYVATVLPDSAPHDSDPRQSAQQDGPNEPGSPAGSSSRGRLKVRWGRSVLGVLGGAGLGAGMAYLLTRAANAQLPAVAEPGDTAAATGGAPGLAEQATQAMPTTGVEHPITGVLLNLRSYDTLMEMMVLLAAVAIALAFLRDDHAHPVSSEAREPNESQTRPSALVNLYVKLLAPVALLLAAWLLFAGSSQPGGAFQAGAALAAVMILLHTSRLRRFSIGPWMVTVLVVGVIAFLAVAVGGLLLGDAWLWLRGPWAGTVTVVLEAVLAVSIGAGLAVIFMASTVERTKASPDREEDTHA